jgi:asparagine synthase (glutamine-hydrolysing)
MCGICGVALADPAAFIQPELLQNMNQTLLHRGPDGFGEMHEAGVGLAMRRLAIIDVAGSPQPLTNEDQTLWLVFNGEIYNFKDLRHQLISLGHSFNTAGDGETVIHGYEQWGLEVFSRLNGMFAVALWDRNRQRLILARDRVGIKPLYYAVIGGNLYFGSELKALLAQPVVKASAQLDPVALRQYLAYEYVPSPRSIFKNIFKLPPGHFLIWENGRAEIKAYWNISLAKSEQPQKIQSLAEYEEALLSALKTSVNLELISEVPLGIFLSGGVDSSAVAAMMAILTPGQVNSFSIGFEDASFDESYYANLVAKHLGTNHRMMTLEPPMLWELVPNLAAILDEPMADSSIIPTYLLSKFARQHVTVALGGDGGDELFAGYPTLQAHVLAGYYSRLPRFLSQQLIPSAVERLPVSTNNISWDFKAKRFVAGMQHPPALRHHLWLGSLSPAKIDSLLTAEFLAETRSADIWEPVATHAKNCDAKLLYNQIMYLDMKMYLENDILAKVDRASMANSLEVRVPLLNQVFLEHGLNLPFDLKLKPHRLGLNLGVNSTSKYLFKKTLEKYLPAEILQRKKKGFNMPVAKWFKGELRGLVEDTFSEERIRSGGIFNPTEIRQLVTDHFSGKRDNRKPLWTLLIFELWRERWNG